MEVVWRHGEVTVRDVYQDLKRVRPIAYTTVMTAMSRLADKGLLRRIEDQPAHRFHALVSKDQYARSAVKSVVDWLVNHFREPTVAYFLDRVQKEDRQVIESLSAAIERRESKKPVERG